jgi:chromosome segregation ATPase
MIKQLFSKLWGRDEKSSGSSVLIKDYPSNTHATASAVVPLHGAGASDQVLTRKKETVERFTESVDRLVEKLEGINDNLSRQTQQNERLAQKLDELPTLLTPVPDAVHQQRQALFQMAEQLRRKLEQDEALTQLLAKLPEQTVRQTESLEAIEDRLSTSADVDTKMTATFEKVSDSLGKLDAGTASQIEWLQQMSRAFSDNERLVKETLLAQQRRFFRVFVISVLISLVSITGLVIAMVLFLYM